MLLNKSYFKKNKCSEFYNEVQIPFYTTFVLLKDVLFMCIMYVNGFISMKCKHEPMEARRVLEALEPELQVFESHVGARN